MPGKKPASTTIEKTEVPPEVEEKVMIDRPQVLLTEREARIRSIIQSAGEAPVVSDVKELFTRMEMQIPAILGELYPEASYRWIDTDTLKRQLARVGNPKGWTPVNRTNHPRVPSDEFDVDGGIQYNDALVLCYRRRDTSIGEQQEVERQFDSKLSTHLDKLKQPIGEVQRGGRTRPAMTVEAAEDPGSGYGTRRGEPPHEITHDNEYDFPAPD